MLYTEHHGVLISAGNETTSDITAAIRVASGNASEHHTHIPQDPSVFCTGPVCELNGNVVTITSSYKSCLVALILQSF